jgi:hypothetical protein
MKCTAHSKRSGKPCKKDAVKGTNVCRSHGAAAPQVKAAAKRRLLEAVDPLIVRLIEIALDQDEDTRVQLAAIRDALDRAGVSEPKQVEVFTMDALDNWIRQLEEELGDVMEET